MKNFLVVVMLLVASTVFAAEFAPLNPQFDVMGTPYDNTFKSTLDNTAKSVRTLAEAAGIAWFINGLPPQALVVSVETKDARYGANTCVSGDVGHVFAVGANGRFSGSAYISRMYFCNSVAADNSVLQITLER